MTTKYFVDADGAYIGGFDGVPPPDGAIEVPFAPVHAAQVWNFDGQAYGPVPAQVPAVVSRFQARAALLQAGLLAAVESAVAQADALTQLAWSEAIEFRRDSPTVAALAAALGWTQQQIDELFVAAAQISA